MKRIIIIGLVVMLSTTVVPISTAQTQPTTAPAHRVTAEPIPFERQVLSNGLTVIYAPMTNAPVVQVRVLYHVGAKDEASDRQGFAHMFEHMMFRGSAHVPSEQHMKLIQGVGGISNAFTTVDQTTYHDTIPTNQLQMALWLEADRMASFKVSDEVFHTERNVVKEEWRMRVANQPFGTFYDDLFALAYQTHNYHWQAIGNMDHLAAAQSQELQDFHDHYYEPDNACLTIAGQFDIAQAKQWVEQYYGWIPSGPTIERTSPVEPQQQGERDKVVLRANLPFSRVGMAYKSPAYRDEDHLALDLLGVILGNGRSSRLYQALVANNPIASGVSMGNYQLDDPGVILVGFSVLPGKTAAEGLARAKAEFARAIAEGFTQEELEKAKTSVRVDLVQARQKAESVASLLAEEQVFGGDARRANQYFDRLDTLTIDDLKRVAAKYLTDETLTTVEYRPGEPPASQMTPEESKRIAATQNATPAERKIEADAGHLSQDGARPAHRELTFPANYPTTAPVSDAALAASFQTGESTTINGVNVITLTDKRLPVFAISLVLRGGGDAVPAMKEGVASLTASMLSRGAGGESARQFAEALEGRGISLGAVDDNDVTRIVADGTIDQIDFAVDKLAQLARHPDFPDDEFAKLKNQALQGLVGSLSDPGSVADRAIDRAVYGEQHPMGQYVTPESLRSITLDDVRAYYAKTYTPGNAVLTFSGAIEPAQANALAKKILDGWDGVGTPPQANYDAAKPMQRQILIIDNPTGQQAVVRFGIAAYDLSNEDRFAGSVAGQVLSSGIDSRLNKVLRAEKGLTYGAYGYFQPKRQAGSFELSIETKPESVDDAVTSAFGVIDKVKADGITDAELAEAKRRVAGAMVMETQTVQQQAKRRVDTILNGYPIDYYNHYAERIADVTADQVRSTLAKYFVNDKVNIVVVGPADQIRKQLEKFGTVTVQPMPLAEKGTTQP